MLIIVIVVFLVCITPDAIMSTVFGFGYVEANNLVKGIRECTDTLLAANSAVNFIIYCLCSMNFRNTFYEIFFHQSGNKKIISEVKHNNPNQPLLDSPTFEKHWVEDDGEMLQLEEKPFVHDNHITIYKGPQHHV